MSVSDKEKEWPAIWHKRLKEGTEHIECRLRKEVIKRGLLMDIKSITKRFTLHYFQADDPARRDLENELNKIAIKLIDKVMENV